MPRRGTITIARVRAGATSAPTETEVRRRKRLKSDVCRHKRRRADGRGSSRIRTDGNGGAPRNNSVSNRASSAWAAPLQSGRLPIFGHREIGKWALTIHPVFNTVGGDAGMHYISAVSGARQDVSLARRHGGCRSKRSRGGLIHIFPADLLCLRTTDRLRRGSAQNYSCKRSD